MKYNSYVLFCAGNESPSMRREWIEIKGLFLMVCIRLVSLHAEGVD